MEQLKKNEAFSGPEGPVVLVIMDGVGIGKNPESDFVKIANTPNLDWLRENAIYSEVKAHGVAVGLPDDGDMGNSEVGHNAIGCGRVFEQGAALVGAAIESGSMYEGAVWQELVANVNAKESALHFIGLFSDGNVHSNIKELCDWGLLRKVALPGDRKDYYEAEKDVWTVVQCITRARKRKELEPVLTTLGACLEQTRGLKDAESKAFRKQLTELQKFTQLGDRMMERVTSGPSSRVLPWVMRFLK